MADEIKYISKITVNGVEYTIRDSNAVRVFGASNGLECSQTSGNVIYNLKQAGTGEIGGIKVSSVNSSIVTVNGESTTAGRYYPVELNADGKAIVNVPWANTTFCAKLLFQNNDYVIDATFDDFNNAAAWGKQLWLWNPSAPTKYYYCAGQVVGDTDNATYFEFIYMNAPAFIVEVVRLHKDNSVSYNGVLYNPNVTQSSNGWMLAADKIKLDGIASGANNYSLPTASSSTLGGVKTTSTVTSNSGYTACPIISGVPYYKDTNTDTKNTAGSTDTSSKIYLVGATSQAANPQTYSHDTAYVGTDGCLYSGGAKVLTTHQSLANYVTLNGDQTITGAKTFSKLVKFNEVDGSCINFDSAFYINKQGGSTLLGSNGTTSWVGMPATALTLRGSATRPTYNGGDLALNSDLHSFTYTADTKTLAITGGAN